MGGKPFGKAPDAGGTDRGNPGRGHFGAAGRDRGRRRGQGQLEAQVLAALQHAPGPVTVAWVRERLGGDLAYTTVMTILSRLHAKQAVSRERSGRAYVWTPAADEAGLAALRMRRVLDGEPDRDAVLTSFVSALSAHDEQVLRTLLDRATDEGSDRDVADPPYRTASDDPGLGRTSAPHPKPKATGDATGPTHPDEAHGA